MLDFYDAGRTQSWLQEQNWNQAEIDALLTQYQPVLDMLDRSLAKPRFQWKKVTSGIDYNPIWSLLHGVELKELSALNHRRKNQITTAIDEDIQALEIARRLETSGGVQTHFELGIFKEVQVLDEFCRIVGNRAVQRQDLERMREQVDHDVDHTGALCDSLRSQMDFYNHGFAGVVSGKNDVSVLQGGMPVSGITRVLFQPNNTRAMFADTIRQLLRDAPLTYDKIDKEPGPLKSLKRLSMNELLLSPNAGGRQLYLRDFSWASSWIREKCRIMTTVAMTRTLIAVRLYWLDNGKLPATLDELVPAYLKSVPVDAYDGKPLRYSPTHKVIYSVGKELTDRGGDMSDGNKDGDKQPTVKIAW